MSQVEVLPELKEIVGAILFAAKSPVQAAQILQTLGQCAEKFGGVAKDYAAATEADVAAALTALREELERGHTGLRVVEVAHGYRLENIPSCGLWLRTFLEKGRANRLSPPALETLAIIAYRQPVMRSEIEAVRGVAVDQILRNLLDLQLIRICGRSDLPGRPWLFGTTQKFLEYFGLRSLEDLPGMDELRRISEAGGKGTIQDLVSAEVAAEGTVPDFNPAAPEEVPESDASDHADQSDTPDTQMKDDRPALAEEEEDEEALDDEEEEGDGEDEDEEELDDEEDDEEEDDEDESDDEEK